MVSSLTEYREVMSTIQSVVMKRATPKLLGGTRLTGTLMAQLLPKLGARFARLFLDRILV